MLGKNIEMRSDFVLMFDVICFIDINKNNKNQLKLKSHSTWYQLFDAICY